jgi:hypothetical protein
LRRLRLIELLGRHVALVGERAKALDRAVGEVEVRFGALRLVGRDGGV